MRTYEDIHPYWINDPNRSDPINISVIFHADGVYQGIGTCHKLNLWSNLL